VNLSIIPSRSRSHLTCQRLHQLVDWSWPMAPQKTIVFLGAPTAQEAMQSWQASPLPAPPLPPYNSTALRPFEIDPLHRTSGVTWRRLADPVDSLSQELADTTMETRSPEDLFLERSLQVYDNDFPASSSSEMEIDAYPSEYSAAADLSISSPYFLTGYDFDVNEIIELDELPSCAQRISPQTSVSIIVAIKEIGQNQVVTTKYNKSIHLVKLVVQDQTRQGFEIACWDMMATLTQSLRVNDIVHFRGPPKNPVPFFQLSFLTV
jgi:hypothetical protein